MTDYFLCCFYGDDNETSQSSANRFNNSGRRIDKSMIGLPTNFQHCTHIGCGDVAMSPSVRINTLENQMNSRMANANAGVVTQQSNTNNLVTHLKLIDLKNVG